MCGIAGYFSFAQSCSVTSKLETMAASIRHRGPDDEGYIFADIESGTVETYSSVRSPRSVTEYWPTLPKHDVIPHHVGLAHVRYSIIDLSTAGHQPMWSKCQSVCLTFNGEIYNYLEIKNELLALGYSFRTSSDTEVLLIGYLAWGACVFERLNGFFAVAIYDRRRRAVLLARDRLGKAHLYLTRQDGRAVFWASEIKAFLSSGCIQKTAINARAVADFLIFNRRDRSGTFWEQVEDFPPGHYAWVDATGMAVPERYWKLPEFRLKTTDISRTEAASQLRTLLCNSLEIRLRADVNIAFELSGGMDSSALVGLAAGCLGRSFTTYTVEFQEEHSNEERFARAVAKRYAKQIDYRIVKPPENNFWQEADEFVWLQEEPFHSPNLQTNQYLRRLLKRDGSHVVITGAAGDEMLAGYAGDYIAPFLRNLLFSGELRQFHHELTSNTELSTSHILSRLIASSIFAEETVKTLGKWRSGELSLIKKILPRDIVHTSSSLIGTWSEKSFHGFTLANMTYRMMNYWLRSGAKSDYGIPIESRAPFLDYRVVEYCCMLPPTYLIHDGWHKHVLRIAMEEYLPEEVLWRRQKMGFPFPYREWLHKSRALAARNAIDIDCPYIDLSELFVNYDALIKVAPQTLWRCLSLMLWWRRVIEGKPILAS